MDTKRDIEVKLAEDVFAYISFKKDKRIITHDKLSKEEHKNSKVYTAKLGSLIYEDIEKRPDLEKVIFNELVEAHKNLKWDEKKYVVHGISLTQAMFRPLEFFKRPVRGIMVSYSYSYENN